ncbi:MAG: hypothetical protein MJ147_08095 [Clostridia bacterium]|nr:hypothetical protein [Clostridia bacterium]
MRKNIFEIVSEKTDIENVINRIIRLFKETNTIIINGSDYFEDDTYCNIYHFVNVHCFNTWRRKGLFIDFDDFLNTLNYCELEEKAADCEESLLTFVELIYNLWFLSEITIKQYDDIYSNDSFMLLKNIMDDLLQKYNHKAYFNEEEQYVLVVEDKPEVTAVAEILPQNLSLDVIRYNHYSLKGRIDLKKAILIKLGSELEAKDKRLLEINKQLKNDIFNMLNNCNIRHNNVSPEQKGKYKKFIADMSDEELEVWYDELYQMLLLAFLILDNEDRKIRVKEFINKLNENT